MTNELLYNISKFYVTVRNLSRLIRIAMTGSSNRASNREIKVSRSLYRLSLLLLSVALSSAGAARADNVVSISFAEQPVRLLRDTSFHSAVRGTRLQNGDLIESGATALQIEGGNGSTVALGPASKVFVRLGPKAFELLLLDGWLKVQARGTPTGSPTLIAAGGLQLDATGGSVILHASPGKTELFVEEGEPGVDEMQGAKVTRRTKVAREQFAVRSAKQALKLSPRAPKEFLAGMPPAFFDILVPVAIRGAPPVPKLERKAAFEDVAPWLADEPVLRLALQHRFNPPKPKPKPSPAPAPAAATPPVPTYNSQLH